MAKRGAIMAGADLDHWGRSMRARARPTRKAAWEIPPIAGRYSCSPGLITAEGPELASDLAGRSRCPHGNQLVASSPIHELWSHWPQRVDDVRHEDSGAGRGAGWMRCRVGVVSPRP